MLTSLFSLFYVTGEFNRFLHYLERNVLFKDEQKGCRKGSRGTKDQLLIDKAILKNCRRRLTNLSMAWIDYNKAYDMVPHSWILKCREMVGAAKNIIRHNQQQYGELEESTDVRRNSPWTG